MIDKRMAAKLGGAADRIASAIEGLCLSEGCPDREIARTVAGQSGLSSRLYLLERVAYLATQSRLDRWSRESMAASLYLLCAAAWPADGIAAAAGDPSIDGAMHGAARRVAIARWMGDEAGEAEAMGEYQEARSSWRSYAACP